ncbi:MAG: type II toxin-antitoxin system VapC family toxin [Methylococcales bacterium]|nr:type II toxin-antitoxin system VapC family toxin [Methylococcales bacterium]
MKPTVYIETSIISYLTSRPSNDIRVAANQNATIEWWETRRPAFDLYVSEFVLTEAGFGHPDAASRRITVLKAIPELTTVEDVRVLGKALIAKGSLPVKAEIDAYHIAVAAVHGIEYLLTWNCTHIANASMRPKIESLCREFGYEPPIICTPQELMEG